MAMSFTFLKDLRIVPYCTWCIYVNGSYQLLLPVLTVCFVEDL